MDNRRLILLLVFSFSLVMLWDAWQRQFVPRNDVASVASSAITGDAKGVVPAQSSPAAGVAAVPGAANVSKPTVENLKVVTDLYVAEISAQGGDLVRLELTAHPSTEDKKKSFVLFQETGKHIYLGQSGGIGEGVPNHKTLWRLPVGEQALKPGSDELVVKLTAENKGPSEVVKTYTFKRNSYQIDVRHEGLPVGAYAYYQITRDGKPAEEAGGGRAR